MNLDGLFVDMYGTLTAGDRAAVEAVCADLIRDTGLGLTARELGIAWGERFFDAMSSANGSGYRTLTEIETATLVDTMAALGHAVEPTPYIARLVEYWRNPPLQSDAREFLGHCPAPVWIVSNADRADLDAALDRLGLRVDGVMTSEDARSYKPHPGIFEATLRQSGWRREGVLHIGDSLHSDVGGARAAGLKSVWINRQHRIHDIGTDTPDYEFAGLRPLRQWLEACLEPLPNETRCEPS